MHFTFYTGTAEALHKTFYFLRLGRITPPPQLTFTAYIIMNKDIYAEKK